MHAQKMKFVTYGFYRGTSHGPVSVRVSVSVCHKSEFYYNG